MLEEACGAMENVTVGSFKGLLVEYAKQTGPFGHREGPSGRE